MNIELYIDQIEQYETGSMTHAERTAFETELTTNAELRQALALYRQSNEVIEQRIENSLRQQLEKWAAASTDTVNADTGSAKIVNMRTNWIRYAAAASVVLLLGWVGMRWAGQYTDAALFAGQYEKPADSAFRSGTTTEHPLQKGFDALTAADYAAAAAFFGSIAPDNERYAEAQYYLGHAAIQQKQYDAAIAAFGHTTQQTTSKFKEKAEWNLLLTYLAAGRSNDPAFRTLLDAVASAPAHSFQVQAEQIRDKLNSFWRKATN